MKLASATHRCVATSINNAVRDSYTARRNKVRSFLTATGDFTATLSSWRDTYRHGSIHVLVPSANVIKLLEYTSVREAVLAFVTLVK